MAELVVDKLCFSYRREPLLTDTDFSVQDGEIVSLLGPSGCGKSTLLKLIAGILIPDRGEIFLGGERINNKKIHQRKITLMFQNTYLFPHMSVEENIAFPMKMQKISKNEQKQEIERLLAMIQMNAYQKRHPDELSGGQRKRVALVRALAARPALMLLDEPFTGLDADLRKDILQDFKKILKQNGITTLIVTHDVDEAAAFSDRCCRFVNKGVQDEKSFI